MPQQHADTSPRLAPFWKSPAGIALVMLALVAGFYILREHWAHVLGNWTYLLLLLCPLMHLFGHGGHGGHGHHQTDQNQAAAEKR